MAEKPKSEKWKGARTRNLSAKQQESAKRIVGGGRSEKVKAEELKAARANAIDIGTTKWTTAAERKTAGQKGRGGLLTDSSGKALTGTVKLPSGKTATYVRGKRIGIMAEKPKPKPRPQSSGSTKSSGRNMPTGTTGKDKPKGGGSSTAGSKKFTPSARQMASAYRGEAQSRRTGNQSGRVQAGGIRAVGIPASVPRNRPATGRGQGASGVTPSMSSAKPPKDGERRTRMVRGQRVVEKYDARNKRWLPLTGSRGGY